MAEIYDVIVAGSGAAGMMAALRAADQGLKTLVVERAAQYGGTSATSGGVMWIPNHGLSGDDSREESLKYINAIATGPVRQDRIEACIDTGPEMLQYLKAAGFDFFVIPWSDYFPEAPGARMDRSIIFPKYDGTKLGEHFLTMRAQFTRFKLLNRYTMDFAEAFTISGRAPGWWRALVKVVGRYWLDLPVRRRTARDRWLSLGAAMIAPFRKALMDRGVEVRLDTSLEELIVTDGRVTGIKVTQFGRSYDIAARHGVIVCAGGFEWSQKLRDRFYTIPGSVRWSSTPEEGNTGKAMEAGMAIGAATEFTEVPWMVPTMEMPLKGISNFSEIHQATFDVGRPHSVCVNRNGDRFVDEAAGYDRFGNAMLDDHLKTGANAPCWLIFDAQFRRKFTAGGFMPTAVMPDRTIPQEWWDHHIFRADTIESLAAKIKVDPAALARTVSNMNSYAQTGVDVEYGRGDNVYDRTFGDASIKPNPCLGPIDKAPYYAILIHMGDLGTKGGLKADARARVLDGNDRPIPGLYAAGNASGTPFGNCYPGAGGTIGPAMIFAYLAANAIADDAHGGAGHNSREAMISATD